MAKDPGVNSSRVVSEATSTIATSLLVRLKGLEPDAWEMLTRMYGPLVFHWCRRAGLGPEDAADVGQEVFGAVAGHIHSFRRGTPGGTFAGWLRVITRNKLRDHWRRSLAEGGALGGSEARRRLEEIAEEDDSASGSIAAAEVGGLYRRALDSVRSGFEERTWNAFWRSTVEGEPAAEVAKELGVSRAAVYIARSRVLARLKAEFADLFE